MCFHPLCRFSKGDVKLVAADNPFKTRWIIETYGPGDGFYLVVEIHERCILLFGSILKKVNVCVHSSIGLIKTFPQRFFHVLHGFN